VEEAFTEASIRYTVVGAMSFYDRKEVRDALSFLRVQVNDRDIPSLRRSLLCVPGVGDGSVRDIVFHHERERLWSLGCDLRILPKQQKSPCRYASTVCGLYASDAGA
jgi:DNA helicase-2/ATP-dependent DNA helicase PcrA